MSVKNPSTINEQINKLKERGCTIGDEEAARETLKFINYYRLVNYFEPFLVEKGRYREGTTFENVLRVYELDRKLRSILLALLEEVEVGLRAVVSNYHALKYGALGYMNSSTFDHAHNHQQFLSKIDRMVELNDDKELVRHHKKKYNGVFPLWVLMELFSFGTLAFFYKDMFQGDKKELAQKYYGVNGATLESWIFCVSDLRNYCAHYNRLYGTKFSTVPRTPSFYDITLSNDVFSFVTALFMLYHDHEKWQNNFVKPVRRLFAKNADVIELSALGFPEDWEKYFLPQQVEEEE